MRTKNTLLAAALGASLLSPTGAHAALTLSVDGNTVYDTDLNITWLQNANLAATNTFGLATDVDLGGNTLFGSYIYSNGSMTWDGAMHWINAMNSASYLGFNDWRLPTVTDADTPGCYSETDCGYNVNTATSEMAHLYFDELGNKSIYTSVNPFDWGMQNVGDFSNVQSSVYWSGTEYALYNDSAWYFNTYEGGQFEASKHHLMYAWAVRDGNSAAVSAVPEPETYAMLLAGLGLLGFTARRRVRS